MPEAAYPPEPSTRERTFIIWAALLALFLGALDALIMSAAMPSIVADLGGLSLYAWVYSAYFLSRAVSLPVFGKLADLYGTKRLFVLSISLFLLSSAAAGMATTMWFLIVCRVFQGIGAGGNFALVYIVLSQVALPGKRAKTLSLASSVWGVSSVLGPTMGGFIVSYFSWRWIFFINIPLGFLSLAGIAFFLPSWSGSRGRRPRLDLAGVFFFSTCVLALLVIFITGGRDIPWTSPTMAALVAATVLCGALFYRCEKRAEDPMIKLGFFGSRNFVLGNGATFLSSLTIFSFFAYVPLYIQGSLGMSPFRVGLAMVSLSLGWSCGALFFGRTSSEGWEKLWSIVGAGILLAGSLSTLTFDLHTSMLQCFIVFLVVGIGMGFVSLSTLIIVQNSVGGKDLGVVTSFHQFGRSLGGTMGVAICGGLVTAGLFGSLSEVQKLLPENLVHQLRQSAENLLRPEFQSQIPQEAVESMHLSVFAGVYSVFLVASLSSLCCLLCCLALKTKKEKIS